MSSIPRGDSGDTKGSLAPRFHALASYGLTTLSHHIHQLNQRFWHDLKTGKPVEDTPELLASKIALMHSELSEALEGLRKGEPDKHLPHRAAEEVELADAVIRIFDYCARRGFDIGAAMAEKLEYNKTREDHSDAARRAAGGKKF